MIIPNQDFIDKFKLWTAKAKKILILPHKSIDPDCLGGTVALAHALIRMGKDVDVVSESVPLKGKMAEIYLANSFFHLSKLSKSLLDYDLIFFIDHAETTRTGLDLPVDPRAWPKTIIIDHHINKPICPANDLAVWREPTGTATCIMMTFLLKFLTWEMTPASATALLLGTYTDTGGMQWGNDLGLAMEASRYLIKCGADIGWVNKWTNEKRYLQLKTWGFMISNMRTAKNGSLVFYISQQDLKNIGASTDDIEAFINEMTKVVGGTVPYILLLVEKNGGLKMSFRTERDDVNVWKIATMFGGGGHRKAAGGFIDASLKEKAVINCE